MAQKAWYLFPMSQPTPPSLALRWGSAIRMHRRARGLLQRDLAAELNVSRALVSRWEAGDHAPADRLRPQIARALGVKVYELFDYPDAEAEQEWRAEQEPAPVFPDAACGCVDGT